MYPTTMVGVPRRGRVVGTSAYLRKSMRQELLSLCYSQWSSPLNFNCVVYDLLQLHCRGRESEKEFGGGGGGRIGIASQYC